MSDPGPQPEPTIEPAEPNPGGADAIDESDRYGDAGQAITPDLPSGSNPAVDEDALPDGVTEGEDKQQEGDEDVDRDAEPAD
ncbi:hypothetical protein INN71_13235 [Nocardioides sp. ChNu-153]|uniref:hypothetical protein n=1 Tax=unclassified Nocardioides TaxID=2615069 RepID=UPI00240641A3|nr:MULTISPECIES: hypothetical protein [unclassified Nocardioides]MDF9715084.1 hypothetical protein [Nocardioides sp. ChNu-99]MDN7122353.1 hypothetical protein [Nocardioides sp. ChNu-153]